MAGGMVAHTHAGQIPPYVDDHPPQVQGRVHMPIRAPGLIGRQAGHTRPVRPLARPVEVCPSAHGNHAACHGLTLILLRIR